MTLRYFACVAITLIVIPLSASGQSAQPPKRNNAASTTSSQGDDPYAQYNQCITDANTAMNQCVDAGKNPLLDCQPIETAQVVECGKKFDHPDKNGNGPR